MHWALVCRVSLRLPSADGHRAQSSSCSPPGGDNELGRRGEPKKEPLCAPGDSPVPGAKITPLVLFIDSRGTGCEWHTDVATAGSASPTCLGPVPCGAGDALQRLCLGIPLGARKALAGCFRIKPRAMGISVAKPRGASSCQDPDPPLAWYPSDAHTEPGPAQLLLSSSRVCNREGKPFFIGCVHTQNEMPGDRS